MSEAERLSREAASVRFCRQCGECVGGVLAILALNVCPGCKASLFPLEERTEKIAVL